VLDPSVLLPQVGQGALAVECRADDDATRAALDAIDDDAAHRAVRAERAFLAELGSGCDIPCGALARADGHDLHIDALLAAPDGSVVVRREQRGSDPEAVGQAVAAAVLRAFPAEAAS
jgi:hydroxymethylbilane synthase